MTLRNIKLLYFCGIVHAFCRLTYSVYHTVNCPLFNYSAPISVVHSSLSRFIFNQAVMLLTTREAASFIILVDSVCTFSRRKFIFAYPLYLQAKQSSSCMKVIGSRSGSQD